MLSHNLPPHQLDAPYTAGCNVLGCALSAAGSQEQLTSQLHFPILPALEQLLRFDSGGHRWTRVQCPQRNQYLRHAVVGEHGDLVDVVELAVGFSVEARPQVGDENLGSLQESDGFSGTFELVFVAEGREVSRKEVHKTSSGSLSG